MTDLEGIRKFIDHISNRLWEDIKMDIDQIDNENDDLLWDWRIQPTDEVVKELGIKFSDLAFEYKDNLEGHE